MKKVLIYSNRKIDDIIWDVSTEKKLLEAKEALFKMLDKDWDMYCDIQKREEVDLEKKCPTCGHIKKTKGKGEVTYDYTSYQSAKKGDPYHINEMLERVKHSEYGSWHIESVM